MNSVRSHLESNNFEELYRKNQIKSIRFLIILSCVLVVSVLLSLRAGSYEMPVGELLKGIVGMAADKKVNIVVRSNRLPRILTAILAGGGLGLSGCILQAVYRHTKHEETKRIYRYAMLISMILCVIVSFALTYSYIYPTNLPASAITMFEKIARAFCVFNT